MVGGKHALVVVACLFAGIGAWGAKVTVSPVPTYASELFGEGHAAPTYPTDIDADTEGDQDGTPVVTLTIPANVAADPDATPPVARVNHDGEALITFKLSTGTFMSSISGLMFDANTSDDSTAPIPATGNVVEIVSGGVAGGDEFVIRVKAADADAGGSRNGANAHAITFRMPRLQGLGALAGAGGTMPEKSVKLHVTSRVVSGEFTDGKLSSIGLNPRAPGEKVIASRDSLTLAITGSGPKTIAIDDDATKGLVAFKSVKEKNKDGYVALATVNIRTQQISKQPASPKGADDVYKLQVGTKDPGPDAGSPTTDDQNIYTPATLGNDAEYHELFDLDGEMLDEGLRGNFMVHATGTRELFNEDDMLFVDYDANGKMGSGEAITIDGSAGMGRALSIDPDKSESFPDGVTGNFTVYYMPGGKMNINHGSMINLTAMVDYSDPSAINETPKKSSTTLNFDGVGNPLRAYAIPHSTNGIGDKGNVRVRCEAPAPGAMACRVFLECWDDMGMRGFGEAPMIAGDSVMVWSGEAIEGVTGMEPTSRHSCRILSKGMVTVQQLTRDGNSGTLVNNTYVGGGM